MTATDTAPSAELEPVLAGALRLLADKPGSTLAELAGTVVPEPEQQPAQTATGFPDLPAKIELDEAASRALSRLPDVFGGIWLDKRRHLTAIEVDMLTEEARVIRDLAPVLGKRLEAIKEIVRVHMDVQAERDHVVLRQPQVDPQEGTILAPATPRDQHGHYLLAGPKKPHQVQVGNVAWSQEYSSGSASTSLGALNDLLDTGAITRKEYLAMTREARVFDDLGMLAFIRKHPARGLEILRKITRRDSAKSSLYLRDVK
jgi:hypothetical protein